MEAAKEAEQAFRRIGPENEQDTTLRIFGSIGSWSDGNQGNMQMELVQYLQGIAQREGMPQEDIETLHDEIGRIVEDTRYAMNDIVKNPNNLETEDIQARLGDLHTEVDKLIQKLLPEGMRGMAPSIRSAEDIRTAHDLAKRAKKIGMPLKVLVEAATEEPIGPPTSGNADVPSWEQYAGIKAATEVLGQEEGQVERMLNVIQNILKSELREGISLENLEAGEADEIRKMIENARQNYLLDTRALLSGMGVDARNAPNIFSLLEAGPTDPVKIVALNNVLGEEAFKNSNIANALKGFAAFEGGLADTATANADVQNQFRAEIRHILTEEARMRIRAGEGADLPPSLREEEFTNLEPEIRTAINETKTILFVTRGGKEQDMRELVALASGENITNPSVKTRQFIADLLAGGKDDFSGKENLQAILGKKRVNADADKTRAAVYQAAWYEIAAAAKTILDSRQDHWENGLMDGKGMQLLPPGLSETAEKAGTFEEKISSYEGILVGFGIKYFAVATFLTNLMVSAKHGDFENPYLFASGAALYGAAKVFDDDIVAQWMHPESKTFTALANIDSGSQMDALRLVFANPREMAAMELLDLSDKDGWKQWVDERDEVADKANENVKFGQTPNYPAGRGVFGANLHELSPAEMMEFNLRAEKTDNPDNIVTQRMGDLLDTSEQNKARYLAVKFLFDEGMTNEDLRMVHQSAVVLAANNRRMQPRSQPR